MVKGWERYEAWQVQSAQSVEPTCVQRLCLSTIPYHKRQSGYRLYLPTCHLKAYLLDSHGKGGTRRLSTHLP